MRREYDGNDEDLTDNDLEEAMRAIKRLELKIRQRIGFDEKMQEVNLAIVGLHDFLFSIEYACEIIFSNRDVNKLEASIDMLTEIRQAIEVEVVKSDIDNITNGC